MKATSLSIDSDVPDARRWNRNINYHPVLLGAVPTGARRALDVGCGEGLLTRQLRAIVPEVVGIDQDAASIERARLAQTASAPITYVQGDVFTHPFAPGSFDMVVSVATLHHMEVARGLQRMAELVRPGGILGVIGLGRRNWVTDPWYDAMQVMDLVRRGFPRSWSHGAPMVWPPPNTYTQVRDIARHELPGSQFQRRALARYTLLWTRPEAGRGAS